MSPEQANAKMLRLLKSIDAKLGQLVKQSGGGITPASARDLDGQYGDPEVRKDPKDWTGASYVSMRFSQCPADYLNAMATYLADVADWMERKSADEPAAEAEKSKKSAKFKRLDAARAAGWALRNKGGVSPRRAAPEQNDEPEPDIPF